MSCSLQSADKTNGRWTKEQHQNFLLGIQMYGKNWKQIEELIGTRNGSQIRSHAQKFFLKFKKSYSNDSNSDQAQLLPAQIQTPNSKCSEEVQTKFSDYSYFLGKIVQYSANQGRFDFWQTLIDHQEITPALVEESSSSRKDSFVEFDEQQLQVQAMSSLQKKIKI